MASLEPVGNGTGCEGWCPLRRWFRRLVFTVLTALTALAVYDQYVRAPDYRTWEGHVFGVPYDFRAPTLARVHQRIWNPDDPRLLTPHVFGVGWTVNLYQLVRLAGG